MRIRTTESLSVAAEFSVMTPNVQERQA
jgi:hypothetical protein